MNRLSLILFIIVSVGLVSCKSHKATVVRPAAHGAVSVVPSKADSDPVYSNDTRISSALVKQAKTWLGTPYRYGGKSKSGTDCSGMMMVIFEDVARLSLPRNSAAQREYCFDVSKKNLEPGDLVFFSTSKRGGKVNHVGMYVGKGKIIHASSSRGVIESSLDEKYYVNHYHSSGRVYGITYAATGGKKTKSKDTEEILLASEGLKDGGKNKNDKRHKSSKSKSRSKRKKSVMSGADAIAVAGSSAANQSKPAPVVEMTLDEFVAMQQTKPLQDTVIVVEDVIEETVETVDREPEETDSVSCPAAPEAAMPSKPEVKAEAEDSTATAPAPEKELPKVLVNGKAVESTPVEKQPAGKNDKAPADSVRQAEDIRESVVKAMKFGK